MTTKLSETPEEHLLGQFIPLHYHFNMLQDQSRMLPFQEAIELVVPEGGTVLELGGGTGVLSWFAARKARRVWCVERNPALVNAARSFLSKNEFGDRVQVVHADAMSFLPPEPVDVVICEMLHVGLLREKQLEIIRDFKERYLRAFGGPLPKFIPDTSLLVVQPVFQDFCFSGYHAEVPIFEPPGPQMQDRWLADPHSYATVDYETEFASEFHVKADLPVRRSGCFNAISLLTNNFLAFDLRAGRGINWLMNQLILPIPRALEVSIGDQISLEFRYSAGGSIEGLQDSIKAEVCESSVLTHPGSVERRAA